MVVEKAVEMVVETVASMVVTMDDLWAASMAVLKVAHSADRMETSLAVQKEA